jgi:RimJ/RimL family protein N-acetyltransferase
MLSGDRIVLLNLHHFWLRVLASNERANHRYERFGLQRKGRQRDGAVRHGGYHDIPWIGMLHGEAQLGARRG